MQEGQGNQHTDVFDQVADLINTTIEQGDFSGLSEKISQMTEHAVSAVNEGIQRFKRPLKKPIYQLNAVNRSGNLVLAVISMVVGGIFGIAAIAFLVLTLAHFLPVFLVLFVVLGIISGVGFFGMRRFLSNTKAYDNGVRYEKVTQQATSARVSDLAEALNQSEEQTKKEIEKLIKSGILPEARFDAQEQYVFLTAEAYKEYKKAYEAQGRTMGEQRKADAALPEEARRIITEGMHYAQEIHACRQKITDPAITGPVDQMEETIYRIINQVRIAPGAASSLHKFHTYYLPTTVRILNAYHDLSAKQDDSEDAQVTKREITETVATINQAYQTIYEDLLREQNWDLQSDMAVMRTMMKQDGLAHTPTPSETPVQTQAATVPTQSEQMQAQAAGQAQEFKSQ